MAKCVVCGSSFKQDFNAIVKQKKQIYEKTGQAYYVYQLDNVWHITCKEYFSEIQRTQAITEYFHISELKTH